MTDGYKHTQVSRLAVVVSILIGVLLLVVAALQGWHPIWIAVFLVVLMVGTSFTSLTVEILSGRLELRFGPGIIRKSFSLRDIRDARPVRNRWWYGWGIRWTPRGWLFNVFGLDAVEILLESGKRYRIGTDEPGELAEAIRRNAA